MAGLINKIITESFTRRNEIMLFLLSCLFALNAQIVLPVGQHFVNPVPKPMVRVS